ncbi:hypothetical protein ACQUQU_09310 [Thalassolituus sp. LLYu03]|uniref:hypothetical protein n=1 Tax=Thalassolituus sp. LLYu03 TaxID=3421656 RepID=UPI003D26904C
MRFLTGLVLMVCMGMVQASELKGVGLFQTLDNPWFLVALYGEKERTADKEPAEARLPEKLQLKVVEDKISIRRYRQLWQDVFAVSQERDVWAAHGDDLQSFFQLVKGPLEQNDLLVIERKDGATVVSLNYREHARLSESFLDVLVTTLTGRISAIPELRDGLNGTLPEDEQRRLLRQFDKGEPTLGRISETGRWLRRQPSVVTEARISQL